MSAGRYSTGQSPAAWKPTCLEMLAQPRRFFANPVLLRQGWCHNIAKTLGSIGGSVFVVLMILSWQGGVSRWAFFDATMLRLESSWPTFWGWVGLSSLSLGWALSSALERLYHWNCDANSKRLVDFDSAVAVARWTSVVFSIPVILLMLGASFVFREPADFLSLGSEVFGVASIAWVLACWLAYYGARIAFRVHSFKATVLLFLGPAQWAWLGVFMGYQLQDEHVLRPNLQAAASYKDDAMSFRYPANWRVSKETDGRVVIDAGDERNVLYVEPVESMEVGQGWLVDTLESLKENQNVECNKLERGELRLFKEGHRCAELTGRKAKEIDLKVLVGKRSNLGLSKVVTVRNKPKLQPGFHLIEQTLQ